MEKTRYGIEVLHWAGMKDEFLHKLQEIILENPELINFENKLGQNAAYIAARFNNLNILKWLIEEGDIDYKKVLINGNILTVAIELNSFEVANYLIDKTDIDYKVKNSLGKNIFHTLMKVCNDELIEKVLKKYPEGINVLDNGGENCLFDFISHFSRHKKYHIFDVIQERMSPNLFRKTNTSGYNLLTLTQSIIANSDSPIERSLKEQMFAPLLGQLEFYIGSD